MKYPNKDYIEHLRRKYPPGTRLQLSCMEDECPVPPGSMGTVECIDDAGQEVYPRSNPDAHPVSTKLPPLC